MRSGRAGPSQAPVSLRDIARALVLDGEAAAAELCAALGLGPPAPGPDGEPAVSLLRLRDGVRLLLPGCQIRSHRLSSLRCCPVPCR